MHELMHACMPENPDRRDYPDQDNKDPEHSSGYITYDGDVSPMQLWYTRDTCSGNSAPDDNCNHNPSTLGDGVTNDISDCTQNIMKHYMAYHA
jgi:hypothetical protein